MQREYLGNQYGAARPAAAETCYSQGMAKGRDGILVEWI